jgi:hypothetical protein
MSKKNLSNPFSTGGGGALFEAHVQAAFVTLMITGGFTPCFPSRPIVEIKLQGKKDGYATDDLIVTTEEPSGGGRRKLLGQVKHSIAFTAQNKLLSEVLQAAFDDFNNPEVFTKRRDAIALITGPLSGIDQECVPWLLDHARATADAETFFRNVSQAHFTSADKAKKLNVIRQHLDAANGGKSLSDEEFYRFLLDFHLLGYDLDVEYSVTRSLLQSHIGQYQRDLSPLLWAKIVELVQQKNKHAAPITRSNIPEELLEMFKERIAIEFPKELSGKTTSAVTDWVNHPDASYLALILLIGGWSEK